MPSSAPIVRVTLLGMESPALLDTASGLSLAADVVWEPCRTKSVHPYVSSTRLQLASGTVVPTEAVVQLYMPFPGKTRRQHFRHISGLTVLGVLEGYSIAHTKMLLNLANKIFDFPPTDAFFLFSRTCPQ